MNEETRLWLIKILRSWLTTWEEAEPKAYPKELERVVDKLDANLDHSRIQTSSYSISGKGVMNSDHILSWKHLTI